MEVLYILRGGDWNILIEFGANVEKPTEYFDSESIRVIKEGLYVSFVNFNYIPESAKKQMQNGLTWVKDLIPIDTEIVIRIDKLNFDFNNFQEEGLFYCIAFWAGKYFNFEVPHFSYFFDKKTNRYVFE